MSGLTSSGIIKQNMERELALRIILEKPPAGVDFGLQKGRGSGYETIQKQRSKAKDLCFEFTIRVKTTRKGDTPNFLGPLVQGPPGGRFVYIDIGTYAGQTETVWSRRLKIPLSGITSEMIDQVLADVRDPSSIDAGDRVLADRGDRVLADPDSLLETRVPGTGKDGGPSCATVKPFPGWRFVRATRR